MSNRRTQHTTGQKTPVDLDEAQQLCEEATRGPWGWRGHDDGTIELRALHSGGLRIITSHRSEPCAGITRDGDWLLLQDACENCVAAYQDPDIVDSSGWRCLKPENLNTVWSWCDKGFIKPLNEWAVRKVPYRADVVDVTHPDARFVARSRELLPRLVDEARKARTRAYRQSRMASVAGDLWSFAHNVLGFLDEHAELLAETDAPCMKAQAESLIDDYDQATGAPVEIKAGERGRR
jgi:hypothetical protein